MNAFSHGHVPSTYVLHTNSNRNNKFDSTEYDDEEDEEVKELNGELCAYAIRCVYLYYT